jgi:RNA-binding protein YlmH
MKEALEAANKASVKLDEVDLSNVFQSAKEP